MLIGLLQRGPCLVLGSKRAEPSAPGLPPCPHPAPRGQGGGGGLLLHHWLDDRLGRRGTVGSRGHTCWLSTPTSPRPCPRHQTWHQKGEGGRLPQRAPLLRGPGAVEGPTQHESEERLLLAAWGRLSCKKGHSGLWAQNGLDLHPHPAQCDRPVAGRSR